MQWLLLVIVRQSKQGTYSKETKVTKKTKGTYIKGNDGTYSRGRKAKKIKRKAATSRGRKVTYRRQTGTCRKGRKATKK